ncbi:MAG: pentapeptide repeat-containing protein [Chloroflexia bacterium]|nr:pentapeptide repeat-containing protein [Chloroflexia bacterium]
MRLGGATLPSGELVQIIEGNHASQSFESQTPLRFAVLNGNFSQASLDGCDLFGARLGGIFRGTKLSGTNLRNAQLDGLFEAAKLQQADLTRAQLRGTFKAADLSQANLQHARLGGAFIGANLSSADFSRANLDAVDLFEANLTDARNLSETQLRHARRLEGATMPDGTRYDGRFRLVGDQNESDLPRRQRARQPTSGRSSDAAMRDRLARRLLVQLKAELQKVPTGTMSAAEAVAETATQAIEQAAREQPNQALIQISLSGLKQATRAIATDLPTVPPIVDEMTDLLRGVVRTRTRKQS